MVHPTVNTVQWAVVLVLIDSGLRRTALTRSAGFEGAEGEAGAMLLAYRLAGLSALEAHYAAIVLVTQSGVLSMMGSRRNMVLGRDHGRETHPVEARRS
jgi:hypothetical protein